MILISCRISLADPAFLVWLLEEKVGKKNSSNEVTGGVDPKTSGLTHGLHPIQLQELENLQIPGSGRGGMGIIPFLGFLIFFLKEDPRTVEVGKDLRG